jgi:hypothetical protein
MEETRLSMASQIQIRWERLRKYYSVARPREAVWGRDNTSWNSLHYIAQKLVWWKVNRFIDHLQVFTTNSYNTVADSHTLQITTC